jgi:tripartite-type tricarboxylate transporter receptor subunit TctC
MKRRNFVGGAAGLAALGTAGSMLGGAPAIAQPKITGDVRFLCGFPPGGNADLLCRLVAEGAKSEIGQNIIVDNKAGAGGFIANETLANAAPDGRTIGLAAMAAMAVSPVMPGLKLPINVDTDLTPIGPVANVYNCLVFAKSAPFRTVPEMIEQAKKNPGKLTYASAGNGTSQHLAGELFKKMAGVDLLHVPYRGGAPAIQDMVSGNVQMMFGNLPEFLGQISGGNLIPISFGGATRAPAFASLPLMSQFVPGYRVDNWFAVFGPRNLPAELVEMWNKVLRTVLAKPDLQKRYAENAMEVFVSSPAELKTTIAADRKKWQEIIQSVGMKNE